MIFKYIFVKDSNMDFYEKFLKSKLRNFRKTSQGQEVGFSRIQF